MPDTEQQDTPYLSEAEEAAAECLTDQASAYEIHDALTAAEPFLATHYEQKGAEGERQRLDKALRHFENEAGAADELILNTGESAMSPRYEVPWRRRYAIERDTYRHVLKTILAALSEKETDQPSGGEG